MIGGCLLEVSLSSWYGLSIKVKDTRLVFSQGSEPFSEEKEVLELPSSACPFDKVIIQGNGFVSTEALQRLSESNINVVMLDKRGKLYSYFHKIGGHEPLVRQKQYDAFRDPKKLEFIRKWILSQDITDKPQFQEENPYIPLKISYHETNGNYSLVH